MDQRISILMTIDEQYAAPLLVTVTSLLERLRPAASLDLYLMCSVLTSAARRKIERAWDDRVRLHWVSPDTRKLTALRGEGHASSPAAWFRLLAGSSLPEDVAKVIYLDADVLIRRDIVELWEQDMRGNIVLAVQDSYIQCLPARCLSKTGSAGERPYFNSGVMVIDLQAWRASQIEQCCVAAVRRLTRRTRWLDQELLNACLVARWGLLAPVWNKQFCLDLFPDWRCSPYAEEDFQAARRDPAIIHFCSRTKPWHWFCDHRSEDVLAYRAALRRSVAGAAPEVNPSVARRTIEFFAAPHRRLLDSGAAAVRSHRRRYALRTMLPVILKLAVVHPWTIVTVPFSLVHDWTGVWWSSL